MMLIPGYKNLFGEPKNTYDELVIDMPSDFIVPFFIAINNELNAPQPHHVIQQRLRSVFAEHISPSNLQALEEAFNRFRSIVGDAYQNDVFGRRYIIALICRELSNYRTFEHSSNNPKQAFNLLIAYFLIVDEVNEADEKVNQVSLTKMNEPYGEYRLIWSSMINQYEFNEDINAGFEMFKLLCLSSYFLDNHRTHLKEYLNSLKLKNIAQFFASINNLLSATLDFKTDKQFGLFRHIEPAQGVDDIHLNLQTINKLINASVLSFNDIKKMPLYKNVSGRYNVIDADAYRKRTYRGPFFEFRSNTTLKDKLTFNSYSREISFEVLEKMCFRSIVKNLKQEEIGFMHFDDHLDNAPDCYYREGNSIFLFEFKGYLFPDTLSANRSFEDIKSYIDQRFVEAEKGKGKGISQILTQIKLLSKDDFKFDEELKNIEGKITIYPIICHDDFFFSLPGINEYLNVLFSNKIEQQLREKFDIKPLCLINLENLFDLFVRNGHLSKLKDFIDRHHQLTSKFKERRKTDFSIDTSLNSMTSFDETYRVVFLKEQQKVAMNNPSQKLIASCGITQAKFDELGVA